MTTTLQQPQATEVFYPCSDGEPVAESYVHLYALFATLEVIRQYLLGQQATVLGNQFMYYAEGFPKLRVAPDVMVIFNVAPGGRDNYKIWEEGSVPSVIFEMTSKGTKTKDLEDKKLLYEALGVQEYWLFDPRGEWIKEQLRGYRLDEDGYQPITDSRSAPLNLRLQVEGQLIGFYREDTGEKLLIPEEMANALAQAEEAKQQAEEAKQQAEEAKQQVEAENERLKAQLRALGAEPGAAG
jgi:Uma2 family endonuclease